MSWRDGLKIKKGVRELGPGKENFQPALFLIFPLLLYYFPFSKLPKSLVQVRGHIGEGGRELRGLGKIEKGVTGIRFSLPWARNSLPMS